MGNSNTKKKSQATSETDEGSLHKAESGKCCKRQKFVRNTRGKHAERTRRPPDPTTANTPLQPAATAATPSTSFDITPDEKYIPQEIQNMQQQRNPNHQQQQRQQQQKKQQQQHAQQKQHPRSRDVKDLTTPSEKVSVSFGDVTSGERTQNARAHGDADSACAGRSVKYSEQKEQERLLEHIMSGAPIEASDILHPEQTGRRIVQPSSTQSQLVLVQPGVTRKGCDIPYVTFDRMTDQHFLYRMNNPRRGVAMIFNNGEFLPNTGMKKRNGYEVDGELMRGTFTKLGFDVHYHKDETTHQIRTHLTRMSTAFHGDADCFVCVLMTHGNRDTSDIVFTKDSMMHLDFIVERFNGENCPTLVGKPKLFFVQACRGDKMDAGQDVPYADEDLDDTDASSKTRRIPVEADILLSQATTPGYLSFRNSGLGSIYVRSLTKALSTYGHTEDILTVLTRVSAMVAFEFESNSSSQPEYSGKKQMPTFTSQLTKRLIFSTPPDYLK